MSEQPQPSSIIFPVALQPEPAVLDEPVIHAQSDSWGWLELFVLSQVFWGVLLFLPGSQAYRSYIRAFPYVSSLIALVSCARRGSAGSGGVPGGQWIFAALLLLAAELVHPQTAFVAGLAQIAFQLAIAAPVFWGASMWISERRLTRLVMLLFGATFVSAALGLLQVYYPAIFLPPEFSSMALKMNPEFVTSLTYYGTGDRVITRPPGLTDLPGGAAISATITAILGFAFAMGAAETRFRKIAFSAATAIGLTVVYLTQVRSLLLMILACMLAMALVRLRQGRVVQSGWIAGSACAIIAASFIWAVAVGGDVVHDRFRDVVDNGVMQSYQKNRGYFLDYTVKELVYEFPFGAGLGRWGMMSVYFGGDNNWESPPLYAEIQPTGWVYDGGLLLCLFYSCALGAAIRHTYKIAIVHSHPLSDLATMVLLIQLLIAGLTLTGPVFNTQVGILFWLLTAMLAGANRTLLVEAWYAEQDFEVEEAHVHA